MTALCIRVGCKMRSGWLVIHRRLIDKPIWKSSTPEQKTILITLLMMVDFKPNEWTWKGEKYKTKPGEKVTSLNTIKELSGKGISIQNVRSALNRFKKLNFLTDEPTKEGRLISIVNWSSYQDVDVNGNKAPNKDLTPNKQSKYPEEIKNFSESFQNHVLKTHPTKAQKVDFKFLEKCNSTVDKLIRLDGFKLDYIVDSLRWAVKDEFWSGQVFSLASLRTKSKNGLKKFQNLSTAYDNSLPEKPKEKVYVI